jgi:hypothetical protein
MLSCWCRVSAITDSNSEVTGSLAVPGIANYPETMAAFSRWRKSPASTRWPFGETNGPVFRATVLP